MNNNVRLVGEDTKLTAAMKMGGGNPGALNVLIEIFKQGDQNDPVGMGGFGTVLMLDTFGIYESRIWMLYKDVCGQDITKLMAVVRACQLGLLQETNLHAAIDGRLKLDTDALLTQVAERLGTFGNNEKSKEYRLQREQL